LLRLDGCAAAVGGRMKPAHTRGRQQQEYQ
jgi:hypothetical protein